MSLQKFLLNLYIWPAFGLVTLFAVLLALPLGLLAGVVGGNTARVVRRGVRIYGFILVRIVPFMAPVTIINRGGAIKQPVIFIANHCSSIDPYLFGMLPYENAFVTSWPFDIPVYNLIMRLARYIDSTRGWEALQIDSAKLLRQGCSLIIWPEGHRSRDGRMARFRNGAFRLACRNKVPIVPVCIMGTHELLPPGQRLLTPSRIEMVVLPAIAATGDPDNSADIKAFKRQAYDSIAAELNRHGLVPEHREELIPAPGTTPCPPIATGLQSHG